jgi:hypothetical protein
MAPRKAPITTFIRYVLILWAAPTTTLDAIFVTVMLFIDVRPWLNFLRGVGAFVRMKPTVEPSCVRCRTDVYSMAA